MYNVDMPKGFYITKEGYIKVIKPKDHPNKGRYIFLHRLVMEKKLGRYLRSEERIYHRDGNKQNNAEENLELFANQSAHAQRGVIEGRKYKLLWDKEWMIEQYINRQKSCSEIAKQVGCREGTVRNALIIQGFKRRRYTLTKLALDSRLKGVMVKKLRSRK
jgi:arginyl-tRNA--protein-N-Asp/Glu arginylyltransferase